MTYATLIDGFFKSGYATEAIRLEDEMSSRGINPNQFFYSAFLSGCCKEGKKNGECTQNISRYVAKGFASTTSFNTLINGLVEAVICLEQLAW